ncbi:pentatricopeptide repeat-containing protein [Quercus suber]|uniref:Pentatricopeptide repeat-containing protein n=1 Tax=Quercus suber TaxID=58331 RepID=A0AAW0JL56_QUESU
MSMVLTATPSSLPHFQSTFTIINNNNGYSAQHRSHSRLLQLLNECTDMSQLKQIHAHTLRTTTSTHSPHTLFLYSRILHFSSLSDFDYASRVFDQVHNPNSFMWNTLIRACARSSDRKEEAIQLYYRMLEQGIVMPDKHTFPFVLKACAYLFALFVGKQNMFEPDRYTMQSVISACAGLGALALGMWAHACVLRKGGADMVDDVLVNNCLVDMYCKCGSWEIAQQVFERMPKRDVNSWNSMILGLAMHGKAETALEYFVKMVRMERIVPDSITFIGVLSACNHRGMVSEGRKYFDMMIADYKIEPRLEHYGCLIDLLARAGLIDEALNLVSDMPMKPDVIIWRSLLDACCKKNVGVELSEEMATQILESEGGDCSGVYVLLSKVYASASRWDDVGMVRKLMTDKGVTKEPGCTSIEIDGISHEFFAGDTSHPQTKEIYQVLDVIEERLESVGHAPDFSQAPMVDELNNEKQHALRLHSERLAIAFGLLSLKPGMAIRIFKNLRVCDDCHKVTKLISRIYNVEIIVRDRARFHHFKDGICSCMDYW